MWWLLIGPGCLSGQQHQQRLASVICSWEKWSDIANISAAVPLNPGPGSESGVFPLRRRAPLEPSKFSFSTPQPSHPPFSFFLFNFNDSKSQKTCIKFPLIHMFLDRWPHPLFLPLRNSTPSSEWHLPFSFVGKLVFTLKLVPWPPSPHHRSSSRAKWV